MEVDRRHTLRSVPVTVAQVSPPVLSLLVTLLYTIHTSAYPPMHTHTQIGIHTHTYVCVISTHTYVCVSACVIECAGLAVSPWDDDTDDDVST